jgi:hypothetical protein
MSLHNLASELKKKGRGSDTELVHMTKGEVKGLQALALAHGGSLTVNPDTGLVEAGFLKNILPVIAGAALTPFLGPMGAGLAMGGFETLRTGDVGKGLMAGLGAYGGANLAGNLATAGASTVGQEAAQNVASQAIADNATTAGMVEATKATTAPVTMSNIGAGFNQITSSPDAFSGFARQNIGNIGMAAAPAIASSLEPKPMADAPMIGEDDGGPNKGKYLSANFQAYEPRRPNPYYRPVGLGYAAGGPILNNMPAGGLAAIQSARDGYGAPQTIDGNIPQMAMGGSIGGYSDGGRMLKGPGDGMSDSIPGVIGNKQPARLADGEFVVPADVVSHLGNGSTDAGAKKLYGMMDKVRQARTGTKQQGKQIKAEKYLPVKKMADGGVTAPASSSSVVTPEAFAGLADLSMLGRMISNTRAPARMASLATPASNSAADQVAAAAAARPVDEPVTFNLSKTKSLGMGYDNIKPDMLIDPSAAGWEMYSSNARSNPFGVLLGSSDDSAGGIFGRLNRSLMNPAPEGSYTDSQGNVWVRKA